jgi:hypothetical protein
MGLLKPVKPNNTRSQATLPKAEFLNEKPEKKTEAKPEAKPDTKPS